TFRNVLSQMAGEELWAGDISFRLSNGESIHLQGHATFIDDEDDKLDKYVVVMTETQNVGTT
ncbi:MAG: hypothetical protein WBH03_03710, partial [Cyclobacteriaceae bacterium]